MRKQSRRNILKLGAATSAMIGLPGCATSSGGAVPQFETPSLKALAAEKGLLFGSAINADQLKDPDYLAIIERECATLVAENEHKWYTVHPQPDIWNFDPGDALVNYAKSANLKMRGHTLLWHREKWSPDWVNELDLGSGRETEAFLETYISKLAGRYAPFIYAWDVVNEAVNDATGALRQTSLSKYMGEEVIDFSFQLAQEYAPGALRVYNDYMSWEDASTAHRSGVLRLLERLLSRGVSLHGLGIQSHSNVETPDTFTREKRRNWIAFCDEVVGMGLDIYVTEFDVNDTDMSPDIESRDRLMASYTKDYFDIMLSYQQTKEVLAWGLTDHQNWLQYFWPREDGVAKRPTLYDAEYKPKPMRDALASALAAAPYRTPL